MNLSEINSNCCFYGRRFNIADFAEGLNNFVQGTDPVTVNGTNYTSFWYRGTIRFNGSAMVPMYFKKKAGPTVKIPIAMTGYIKGYATLADRNADTNALFNVPFTNLRGIATYTIRGHSTPTPGMENHFDIVSVSYEVAL
jgi:hypothetical protein